MADTPNEKTAPAPSAPPKPQGALPEPDLIVSSSPHFHTAATVDSIMRWVLIALAPACLAGIYFFGWNALRLIAVCTLAFAPS